MSGRADPRAIVLLDRCPRCEYGLAHLPRRHTCPECGLAYDENTFVLESKPRGGSQLDHLVSGVFVLLLPALLLFAIIGPSLGVPFLLLLVLLYIASRVVLWALERLRQRPGKGFLIWVNSDGIAVQPVFRWKKRQPWVRFRRPNAHAALTFLQRAGLGRWRLRVGTRWPRLLHNRGIDVYLACSKREIALVRNAMRRLRLGGDVSPRSEYHP
ncbi:MAG: hypothetical protein ACYS0D_07985 [Planctomycetota bacterium]